MTTQDQLATTVREWASMATSPVHRQLMLSSLEVALTNPDQFLERLGKSIVIRSHKQACVLCSFVRPKKQTFKEFDAQVGDNVRQKDNFIVFKVVHIWTDPVLEFNKGDGQMFGLQLVKRGRNEGRMWAYSADMMKRLFMNMEVDPAAVDKAVESGKVVRLGVGR